jgi:hypothetical protein
MAPIPAAAPDTTVPPDLTNHDPDTFRIMISSDNHLGFAEKDPVRGDDSFAAFEEMLYLARKYRCDTVLVRCSCFVLVKRFLGSILLITSCISMNHASVSFLFAKIRSWAGTCSMTIGRVGGASIGPWKFCATTAWATMPCGSNPCPAIDTITSIRTTTSNFPSFLFTATTTIPVAIRGPRICWHRLVRTL